MKKNCLGCKALTEYGCDLGFKQGRTETIKAYYYGEVFFPKPLENCPKPTTYKKYMGLRENKRRNK